MARWRSVPQVLAIAACAFPGVAHAEDRAAAQQLFQRAKDLLRAGNVAQACSTFEAAAQLSPTPGVRLNLADCWRRLGRTASAWSKFDEAAGMAERTGDSVAAETARKGRAELESQLVYLTVVVGDATVPGLQLKRDGESLPAAAWGTPIPVDPGVHKVSAEAPGRAPWSTTTTVDAAAKKVRVVVPPLDVVPTTALAPVPATPSDPSNDTPEAHGSAGTRRLLGWVSAGIGLVGAGVGTAFTVEAFSERSAYHAHLTPNGQACADPTCASDSHTAYADGNGATAAFILGGVFLATGVVLLVTAPRQHSETATLFPIVYAQGAGLGLTSRF